MFTRMDSARYEVWHGDDLALLITDEPGVIVSELAPPPPPGTELERHPFLSLTARLAEEEGDLRDLLDESASTGEFLDRLRAAGYRVARVE